MTEKIYQGKLSLETYEEDLLCLSGDQILAELIKDDIEEYGHFLSVRYYISDAPLTEDELQSAFLNRLEGTGTAQYFVHYSEITGYLWTDEEIMVGGHDLLEELKSHLGQYLHLCIDYHKEAKEQAGG